MSHLDFVEPTRGRQNIRTELEENEEIQKDQENIEFNTTGRNTNW